MKPDQRGERNAGSGQFEYRRATKAVAKGCNTGWINTFLLQKLMKGGLAATYNRCGISGPVGKLLVHFGQIGFCCSIALIIIGKGNDT